MYESYEFFKHDALACGTAYYPDTSLQPQNIDAAYKIYQNVRKGTTLLDADGNKITFGVTIVGRLALKVKTSKENGQDEYTWLPSDELFPSIDKIMRENLGTVAEGPTDQIGSILDSRSWSLLANDAWLLGGIHAMTEFHFASLLRWSNLWDDTMKRITVTAREVIGITSHGYKISTPNPKLEAVAICIDRDKAVAASLLTYKEQLQNYLSVDSMLQFFNNLTT